MMASKCYNRDPPAHAATHGKRKRVAVTPLPVHSSLRGFGRGRENTCARQSWPPRVATEMRRHTLRRTRVKHRSPSMGTHRHASPRTASESVSLQRRFPSTLASEAPATGGKTRAHDNHGLHLFCLGRAAVVVLRCFQLRWVRCQAWITPPKEAASPSTPPSPSSGAIPRYSFQVGGWHLKNAAVAPPQAQQRKFHTSTPMR